VVLEPITPLPLIRNITTDLLPIYSIAIRYLEFIDSTARPRLIPQPFITAVYWITGARRSTDPAYRVLGPHHRLGFGCTGFRPAQTDTVPSWIYLPGPFRFPVGVGFPLRWWVLQPHTPLPDRTPGATFHYDVTLPGFCSDYDLLPFDPTRYHYVVPHTVPDYVGTFTVPRLLFCCGDYYVVHVIDYVTFFYERLVTNWYILILLEPRCWVGDCHCYITLYPITLRTLP